MEPITTTAMIGTVVGYLAKTLKDNKSIQDFFNNFTEATVKWIRPIFLKEDEQPKEVIEKLQQKPESPAKQEAVKAAIASELEDNPTIEAMLKEMYETILAKEKQGAAITIINSKNVVTGNINTTSGNVHVGDSNTFDGNKADS